MLCFLVSTSFITEDNINVSLLLCIDEGISPGKMHTRRRCEVIKAERGTLTTRCSGSRSVARVFRPTIL